MNIFETNLLQILLTIFFGIPMLFLAINFIRRGLSKDEK